MTTRERYDCALSHIREIIISCNIKALRSTDTIRNSEIGMPSKQEIKEYYLDNHKLYVYRIKSFEEVKGAPTYKIIIYPKSIDNIEQYVGQNKCFDEPFICFSGYSDGRIEIDISTFFNGFKKNITLSNDKNKPLDSHYSIVENQYENTKQPDSTLIRKIYFKVMKDKELPAEIEQQTRKLIEIINGGELPPKKMEEVYKYLNKLISSKRYSREP